MDISVQLLVDTRETREEVISKQYPSGWIFPINLPVKVQSVIFFRRSVARTLSRDFVDYKNYRVLMHVKKVTEKRPFNLLDSNVQEFRTVSHQMNIFGFLSCLGTWPSKLFNL